MSWFKIDDGFYDHPKVLTLPMAARGLWLTAGTWCAKHLTDGVIPARQAKALGGTAAQVRALIDHGLWIELDRDQGGKCYAFHDWNDMQPARKDVLKSREIEREKKREWRRRKDANQQEPENVPGGQSGGQDGGHFRPSRHPDPTRPDPARPDHIKEGGQGPITDRVREHNSPPIDPPDSLDALAAAHANRHDPERCDAHQGIAEENVPNCWACANARKTHRAKLDAEAKQAGQSRRALIDACDMCDDNGWILIDGVATKCTHHHERKSA